MGKPYWGQGLMSEAVTPMIDFGFRRMSLNRIVIRMDPRNVGSWRVAEKCGRRFEGIARQVMYAKARSTIWWSGRSCARTGPGAAGGSDQLQRVIGSLRGQRSAPAGPTT